MAKDYMLRETSIYLRLANEMRYTNSTLMVNVQSVTTLPQIIREGASVVLCKRLNDQDEVSVIGKMMNFSSQEQYDAIMSLKISDAIFIDKERGSIPISVIVPNYPTQVIDDEMIDHFQSGHIHRIIGGVIREKPREEERAERKQEDLAYNSKVVLEDLKRFPFDFQHERERRLSMNVRIISDTLDGLLKQGWIRKHDKKINLGKGKGQFQPYLFTEKTVVKFGKQNILGKGSIDHAFRQYRADKHYSERGYQTEMEHFLSDRSHSVDLVVTKNGQRLAVEIELNDTPHVLDNIHKCIHENFDLIIIAVYGAKLLKRIQKLVLADELAENWLRQQKLQLMSWDQFLD
ncbi:hypothetical protein BVY01_03420 [bacterium I07]|nr:hypothetical protein BVY01_03420 [bacterium I07]